MSSLKITNISNKDGDSGAIISGISTASGTGYAKLPSGSAAQRVGIESGSLRYNSDANEMEFYNGDVWVQILEANRYLGTRGLFSTGGSIESITFASLGDGLYYGGLLTITNASSACSSSTRGVFGGGANPVLNTMEYVTIVTTGNALDFGDLTVARSGYAACSSSTRGIFGGGYQPTPLNTYNNTIDYITIATTGNAIDFGDLGSPLRSGLDACSSSTRGVFGGGTSPAPVLAINVIQYVTIATTGNALDFGDLTVTRGNKPGSCSSSTRGIFGGGIGGPSPANLNSIDYITIATTGDATDFGDLTVGKSSTSAVSSSIRGVFGDGSPSPLNTMDYITIATTGNASIFGNLTEDRNSAATCSDGHGGL